MASLRISDFIQRTPDGQEYFEVIIPPFTPGTNRKVLLSDIIVPDATDTVRGKAKLYQMSGSNTDGSMDQNSITDAIQAASLGIVKAWKEPVLNATTANITLSGEQTIDGILTSASRILVKDQTTQSQNGIYVTAAGAWARSSDADSAAEIEGAAVTVQQGTLYENTSWLQTTDNVTLGSSNIVWSTLGTSVQDASETVKGITEEATTAEMLSGASIGATGAKLFITPSKLKGLRDLSRSSASVVAGVMNLNCASKQECKFENTTPITSNFAITFSNETNAEIFTSNILITGTVVATLQSSVVMEKDNARWTNGTKSLTLVGGTAEPFTLSFNRISSTLFELRATTAIYPS